MNALLFLSDVLVLEVRFLFRGRFMIMGNFIFKKQKNKTKKTTRSHINL